MFVCLIVPVVKQSKNQIENLSS